MSCTKYYIIFLIFCLQYLGFLAKVVKIARVYHIEQCKVSNDTPVIVNELRLFQPKGKSTVFYMNATVTRDIVTDPKVVIKVVKCLTRENPDTCETFSTLRPTKPCMFMFMKNMMWTNVVENIEPPISCHVKKGHYILKNATADPNLFQIFPIEGYNWKFEITFSTNPNNYLTICVDSQVIPVIV